MPRLVPIAATEIPALLALRRTLWQLAIIGIATAATLARIAPDSDSLALWCVLIPLSALAVHFRQPLLNLLLHRHVPRDRATPRRMQRAQARRAHGDDNAASKRRQARARLLRQAQLNRLAR